MKNFLKRFFLEEDGQGMTEYAVILLLIAIAVFVLVNQLGGAIGDRFEDIRNRLQNP